MENEIETKKTESIGVTEMQESKISLPCGLEPQFGNCSWNWVSKYNAYMCSICGDEFFRPLTREQIESELKEAEN